VNSLLLGLGRFGAKPSRPCLAGARSRWAGRAVGVWDVLAVVVLHAKDTCDVTRTLNSSIVPSKAFCLRASCSGAVSKVLARSQCRGMGTGGRNEELRFARMRSHVLNGRVLIYALGY
jgi:hypothetical protein